MGNFGVGGLHKPTTWIRPFRTTSDLPADALDGSAAVVLSTHQIWEFDRSSFTWFNTETTGGGASQHVDFTPTTGQTTFVLPSSPTDPTAILMEINHVTYYPPLSFSVGGPGNQTVTWLNAFILDPGDSIRIYF